MWLFNEMKIMSYSIKLALLKKKINLKCRFGKQCSK